VSRNSECEKGQLAPISKPGLSKGKKEETAPTVTGRRIAPPVGGGKTMSRRLCTKNIIVNQDRRKVTRNTAQAKRKKHQRVRRKNTRSRANTPKEQGQKSIVGKSLGKKEAKLYRSTKPQKGTPPI